jgi:hypothetical protein
MPRVRFEAIGEGWRFMTKEMGTWVAAILITIILEIALSFATSFFLDVVMDIQAIEITYGQYRFAFALAAGDIALQIGLTILSGIFQFVLYAGLYYMAVRQVTGQQIELSDMFSGFARVKELALAYFLVAIIIGAGTFLCLLPGLFLAGLLMLTVPIIMHQHVGAVEAMERSFEALKRQWWLPGIFLFVLWIVTALGLCACCIGLLWTLPLLYLCHAIVYRDFFYGPPTPSYAPYGVPPTGYGPAGPAGPAPPGYGPQAPSGPQPPSYGPDAAPPPPRPEYPPPGESEI